MADNDAPRFGQRSDNWTPDGSQPTPGEINAGGAGEQGGEQASSWPQYGQLDRTAQSPQPTWGQYQNGANPRLGDGAPVNTAAGSQNAWPQFNGTLGDGAHNNAQSSGGQFVNPGTNPYLPGASVPGGPTGPTGPGGGGSGRPGGGSEMGGAMPQLPSRTVPVVLMVVGALMTLVLSVVVFLVMLVNSVNLGELAQNAGTTGSGDTLTVDDTGVVMVVAIDDGPLSCTLTDSSGDVTEMEAMMGTADMLSSTDLTPGDYVLECDDPSRTLSVITGISPDEAVSSTMKAFVWGTVIGLVGTVLFIVGTVKLVRTNRKRREIQRAAWQQRY